MCLPGYEFDPDFSDNRLVCQADRAWGPTSLPRCQRIVCPTPRVFDHMEFRSDAAKTVTKFGQQETSYRFGDVIEYYCANGYKMEGRSTFKSSCQANREWSGEVVPQCLPKSCGTPPIRKFGSLLDASFESKSFTYLQSVEYHCNEGYEFKGDKELEIITCTANGFV